MFLQSEQSKKDKMNNPARYDDPNADTVKIQGTSHLGKKTGNAPVMSTKAGSEFASGASITTFYTGWGDLFKSEPG